MYVITTLGQAYCCRHKDVMSEFHPDTGKYYINLEELQHNISMLIKYITQSNSGFARKSESRLFYLQIKGHHEKSCL